MKVLRQQWLTAVLAVFIGCGLANAQTMPVTAQTEPIPSPATLIEATQRYKASSEELLSIHKNEVSKAPAKLDEVRRLVTEGLVAKSELEDNERFLEALRAQLEATQKQITESDLMIADLKAEQEAVRTVVMKPVLKQYGVLNTTATLLRYSGRCLVHGRAWGNPKLFFVDVRTNAAYKCRGAINNSQSAWLRSS